MIKDFAEAALLFIVVIVLLDCYVRWNGWDIDEDF